MRRRAAAAFRLRQAERSGQQKGAGHVAPQQQAPAPPPPLSSAGRAAACLPLPAAAAPPLPSHLPLTRSPSSPPFPSISSLGSSSTRHSTAARLSASHALRAAARNLPVPCFLLPCYSAAARRRQPLESRRCRSEVSPVRSRSRTFPAFGGFCAEKLRFFRAFALRRVASSPATTTLLCFLRCCSVAAACGFQSKRRFSRSRKRSVLVSCCYLITSVLLLFCFVFFFL